jgi:hypothetical protein
MTMKFAAKLVLLPLAALALAGVADARADLLSARRDLPRLQDICISRDEAVKLGIVHGAGPATPTPEADAKPSAEAMPDSIPDPAPEATPAPKPMHKPRVKPARLAPAKPAANEPELASSPTPPAPDSTATTKPAPSGEKSASPFGVLDPANVPPPLR